MFFFFCGRVFLFMVILNFHNKCNDISYRHEYMKAKSFLNPNSLTYLIPFSKRRSAVSQCSFYFQWSLLHLNMIHHLPTTMDQLSLPGCYFVHGEMWILFLNGLIRVFLMRRSEEHFSFCVDYSWICVLTLPC